MCRGAKWQTNFTGPKKSRAAKIYRLRKFFKPGPVTLTPPLGLSYLNISILFIAGDPTRSLHEQQITVMLLTITFTFLALLGWQCVTQCLYSQEFEKEKELVWQYVTNSYVLGKLGLVINSAMNCLFYCFAANNFRKELRRMLNCAEVQNESSQQHQPSPNKQHVSRWEEPSKSVSSSYGTSNVMSNLV